MNKNLFIISPLLTPFVKFLRIVIIVVIHGIPQLEGYSQYTCSGGHFGSKSLLEHVRPKLNAFLDIQDVPKLAYQTMITCCVDMASK